jgi:ATP-dependent DNA helicase RecQ
MCAVLDGVDTVVVLPTGFGKSLIYQVAGLLGRTPTVVISPLIALMMDQERKLAARGAPVVRIDSSIRVTQRRAALERLRQGGPLIVLTTPETLASAQVHEALREAAPWLFCVDEAHSISEWGHDFRPAYLRLGVERTRLGNPVLLALTATATPRVREDIAERLGMEDAFEVVRPPDRENLRLSVEIVAGSTKVTRAGRLIRRLPRPGIVYCSTTIEVDRLEGALRRARVPVARYHGKLKKSEREAAQRRFMRPSKRLVMIATSAFGMGIDKSNIRYVVHYQAPGSLEQYVQEAGRAGRDGRPARCILLFDEQDLEIQRHLQEQGRLSASQLRRVANAVTAYDAEEEEFTIKDVAGAAGVSRASTETTLTKLEQLGVVSLEHRRVTLGVSSGELDDAVKDLRARLFVQAREDERRLGALASYASSDECRSRLIRRYFGEVAPPRCGRCDRCQKGTEELAGDDALRAATQAGLSGQLEVGLPRATTKEPQKKRSRRRRGRGRRRHARARK